MKATVRMWRVLAAVARSGFVATEEVAPDCGLNPGMKAIEEPNLAGAVPKTSGVGERA